MVGRGWWLVVWSVCAAGRVCVVCGGSWCQQGQEYYSSQQGQCVPCTRCHDPLVVVAPCYVYRDAVCAPATQFLPDRPQAPVVVDTPSAPTPAPALNHTKEVQRARGHHTSQPAGGKDTSSQQKHTPGYKERKMHNKKRQSDKQSHSGRRQISLLSKDSKEKKRKTQERHHRHRHRGHHHRAQNQSVVVPEESVVNNVIVIHKSGAISEVSDSGTSVLTKDSVGESKSKNISDGANSDKSGDSYLHQLQTVDWQAIFFLTAAVIISTCLLVLIIVILSHFRNLAQQKLKRVSAGVETTVMEQLLASQPAPPPASRGPVTYVRAPAATTTHTSSRLTVEPITTEPGHLDPPIPFTMDRLLEQRRVLGTASSLDTNLYVESWQQQDYGDGHYLSPSPAPVTSSSHRTFIRGAVSASPSPAPVRTYRPAPASASASPILSMRRVGWARSHAQGGLATCASGLSRSTGGFVVRDCSSGVHTYNHHHT